MECGGARTHPSVGEDDGHDGGGLHDPGERVPHEPQELEKLALLQIKFTRHTSFMIEIWDLKKDIVTDQLLQIDGLSIRQRTGPEPDLLLLELVGAEDLEPAGAIVGGEPVRRGLEDGEHLLDRDALLQTHAHKHTGQD